MNIVGSSTKKKSLSPYITLSGIFLIAYSGIQFHYALFESGVIANFYQIESIIGTVAYYLGIVTIIIPIAVIGSVFRKRRRDVTTAIALIIGFVGFDLFLAFVPEIALLGGGWGGFGVIVGYGIVRGLTFLWIVRALNIPRPGFGNFLFAIFGWSFLVTSVIGLIMLLMSMPAGIYLLIAQYYINALCLGLIGLKFNYDAMNKGPIQSLRSISKKTAPQQPITKSIETAKTPVVTHDTQPTNLQCAYCGSQYTEGSTFCDTCGQKLE